MSVSLDNYMLLYVLSLSDYSHFPPASKGDGGCMFECTRGFFLRFFERV